MTQPKMLHFKDRSLQHSRYRYENKNNADDLFLILPFLSTLTGLAILDLSKYFLQSDGMSSLDRMSGGLDETWDGEAQKVLRTRKIIYK